MQEQDIKKTDNAIFYQSVLSFHFFNVLEFHYRGQDTVIRDD